MFLKNSKQRVAVLGAPTERTPPTLRAKTQPDSGYVDVVLLGKPGRVCRVAETSLVKGTPRKLEDAIVGEA